MPGYKAHWLAPHRPVRFFFAFPRLAMKLFPQLPGLGLLLALLSCETSKPNAGEFGSPTRSSTAVEAPASRQIARITDNGPEYLTPRADLAAAFIRQFGDGTVVDKILVRPAPASKGETKKYYLIGMGLNGGNFRAMALLLTGGGDNTFYLSPGAKRYIITSRGCPMCLFNFEEGEIVGSTCSENVGGVTCELQVENSNELFVRR